MTTRRHLLKGLLGAGALAGLGPVRTLAAGPAPRTLRVSLALPAGSAAKGAAFGAEEARQTAGLLGARFELSAGPGALAVIGERAPAGQPRGLFFTVGTPGGTAAPVRPRLFHVASSPRFRQGALAKGKGLRVVDWHPGLHRFGAEQLNQRFERRFGTPMDEGAWRGWMAVKIAAELALRGLADPVAARFDGHKGRPLRFDPGDHHLVQPVYLVDARGKIVEEVMPE